MFQVKVYIYGKAKRKYMWKIEILIASSSYGESQDQRLLPQYIWRIYIRKLSRIFFCVREILC
jgi:hypothetical protein